MPDIPETEDLIGGITPWETLRLNSKTEAGASVPQARLERDYQVLRIKGTIQIKAGKEAKKGEALAELPLALVAAPENGLFHFPATNNEGETGMLQIETTDMLTEEGKLIFNKDLTEAKELYLDGISWTTE